MSENVPVMASVETTPVNGAARVNTEMTRQIECPADLFGAGRYIVLRPMKMRMQRQIRKLDIKDNDDDVSLFQDIMAEHILEWNVNDAWTGEELDVSGEALDELTDSQWIWLTKQMSDPNLKASVPAT